MKNMLIIILVCTFYNCTFQKADIDYVRADELKLSDQVGIGETERQLLNTTLDIDSVVSEFDSLINMRPHKLYYIGKSSITVEEGVIVDFEIIDDSLSLFDIMIGDDVGVLKDKFPNSYHNIYRPEDNGLFYFKLGTLYKDGVQSGHYYVLFSIDEGKVTAIEFWENT